MEGRLDRAWLLYRQKRFDLAARECLDVLARDPEAADAHLLLALCRVRAGDQDGALESARAGVRLAPGAGWAHYVLGKVRWFRDEFREAEKSLGEAVRLEPENHEHRWMQVDVFLSLGDLAKALGAADAGVRLAPQSAGLAASRGVVFYNLARRDEAEAEFRRSLSLDAGNDVAHAGLGRLALARGKADAAVGHFRDSLRLDPTDEWAREGLVDALKARYPVYGLFVRYFEWSRTLDPNVRRILTVAVAVVAYFARLAGKSLPTAATTVLGVAVLLAALFVFLSWLAGPVFNLVLRMSPEGRLLLTPDETRSSTVVGLLLLGAALFGVAAAAGGWNAGWIVAGATCIAALPSAMATYRLPQGSLRTALGSAVALCTFLGIAGGIAFIVVGTRVGATMAGIGIAVLVVLIWYDVLRGFLRQ